MQFEMTVGERFAGGADQDAEGDRKAVSQVKHVGKLGQGSGCWIALVLSTSKILGLRHSEALFQQGQGKSKITSSSKRSIKR